MGVEMSSAVYLQMVYTNAGKQVSTGMYRTSEEIFQRLF